MGRIATVRIAALKLILNGDGDGEEYLIFVNNGLLLARALLCDNFQL